MPQVNTFEDAIKVAIQHYWDENIDDTTPALSKVSKRKYTKDYFNKVAEEKLPKADAKPPVPPAKKTKK